MPNRFLTPDEAGALLFGIAKECEPKGSRRVKDKYWRAVASWLSGGVYG